MKKFIKGAKELGIELNDRQLQQFELYYRELIEWNKKINLTAITDFSGVQVKHFLDSLSITLALTEGDLADADFNIIDIGTGAGFPGIPLKIVFPQLELTLVESTSRKVSFLNHVVQKLNLNGLEVVNGRAEDVAHSSLYRERFALAVSRAVAALPTLVELTLPFCRIGGKFVAQKKGECSQEIASAQEAIATLGGELDQVKKIEIKAFDDERYLVIIDKICPTPGKYPRRPGLPGRRPIQEV